MHPTIDEQLDGALRLLDLAEAESDLTPSSVESLANVRRLLKQVRRSWSGLLPFYVADNEGLVALLARCGAASPPESEPSRSELLDVGFHAARNAVLRQELTDLIGGLGGEPGDDDARAEIITYLVERVAADPS